MINASGSSTPNPTPNKQPNNTPVVPTTPNTTATTTTTSPGFPTHNPAIQNKNLTQGIPSSATATTTAPVTQQSITQPIVPANTPPVTPAPNSTGAIPPATPKFPDPTKNLVKVASKDAQPISSGDSKGNGKDTTKPKKKLNLKMVLGVVVLLLVILGSGAGFFLSQQTQDLRQKAAESTLPHDDDSGIIYGLLGPTRGGADLTKPGMCDINESWPQDNSTANGVFYYENWNNKIKMTTGHKVISDDVVRVCSKITNISGVQLKIRDSNQFHCPSKPPSLACDFNGDSTGCFASDPGATTDGIRQINSFIEPQETATICTDFNTDVCGLVQPDWKFDNTVNGGIDGGEIIGYLYNLGGVCEELNPISCDNLTDSLTSGIITDPTQTLDYSIDYSGDQISKVDLGIHGNFEGPGWSSGWVIFPKDATLNDGNHAGTTTFDDMVAALVATGHDEQLLLEKGIIYYANVYGPNGFCTGSEIWSGDGSACNLNPLCNGKIELEPQIVEEPSGEFSAACTPGDQEYGALSYTFEVANTSPTNIGTDNEDGLYLALVIGNDYYSEAITTKFLGTQTNYPEECNSVDKNCEYSLKYIIDDQPEVLGNTLSWVWEGNHTIGESDKTINDLATEIQRLKDLSDSDPDKLPADYKVIVRTWYNLVDQNSGTNGYYFFNDVEGIQLLDITPTACAELPSLACNNETCDPTATVDLCTETNLNWSCDSTSKTCRFTENLTDPDCEPLPGAVACNKTCTTNEECELTSTSYSCDIVTSNTCRLTENLTDEECLPEATATPTPEPTSEATPTPVVTPAPGCNDTCITSSDCASSNHSCTTTEDGSLKCRLESYPTSLTCTLPISETSQPTLPPELPQTGPEDWMNWLKAGLVTMGLGAALFFLL